MGGITGLQIVPLNAVNSFFCKDGLCKLIVKVGFSPINIYFSPGSAMLSSDTIDNSDCYRNNLSWRTPKNRPDLLKAVLPFINKRHLFIISFANGVRKVLGSPDFPIKLSCSPASQGTPADYNGMVFSLSGVDFAPGFFLSFIDDDSSRDYELFPLWIDNYHFKSSDVRLIANGPWSSDFSITPVGIADANVNLGIANLPSQTARASFLVADKKPRLINSIAVEFTSITSKLSSTKLYFVIRTNGQSLRFQIPIPSVGIVSIPVNASTSPSLDSQWGFELEKIAAFEGNTETSLFLIKSVEFL